MHRISSFALSMSVGCLLAQSPPSAPLAFEAASVKPSPSGTRFFSMNRLPGGGLRATGATLGDLLMQANGVESFQIIGGPEWVNSARYDIYATTNHDGAPENQRRQMIQSLLADRFKVILHRETKELPIYALTLTKGGSKLVRAEGGTCPDPPVLSNPCGGFRISNRSLMAGNKVTVAQLAADLTFMLGRLVVDQTGLNGIFDIRLEWTPDPNLGRAVNDSEPPPSGDGPSIFTAIQEQLGLKLESRKGPTEILVIDHAEKPSPD
jgi:uncharacterized protein (TIGR03435 family)